MTAADPPELDVRAAGEHAYQVAAVTEGGTTEYRLTVPGSYLEGIGADDRSEPSVVRVAAELLLEQGVAPSGELSLDRAESVAPGFEDRLRAALRR